MATYALINSNVVVDEVVGDAAYATAISGNYQYVVNLTGISPQPKIGDTYNGSTFTVTANPAAVAIVTPYTGQQYFPVYTLTDAATVSWDLNAAQAAKVTLAGSRTLSVSNVIEGSTYTLTVKQDATGGRTLSYTSGQFLWPGGSSFTLSTAASAVDVLTFLGYQGKLIGSGMNSVS